MSRFLSDAEVAASISASLPKVPSSVKKAISPKAKKEPAKKAFKEKPVAKEEKSTKVATKPTVKKAPTKSASEKPASTLIIPSQHIKGNKKSLPGGAIKRGTPLRNSKKSK